MLIVGALASTVTACPLQPDKTPSDPTDTDTDPSTTTGTTVTSCLQAVNCPTGSCQTSLTIRWDDLETCYGAFDVNSTSWPSNTPSDVQSQCTTKDTYCTIEFTDHVQGNLCAYGNEGDTVSGAVCGYSLASSPQADSLLTTLQSANCNGLFDQLVPQGPDCGGDASDVTLGSSECGSCDTEQGGSAAARKGRPPGTTNMLSLDPAHSFLAVSTPIQSVTVRLSGDAFVDLSGNRLLGLQISADQAHILTSDWKGFSFSLDKPVPLARAGEALRIQMAARPTIIGTGRRNEELTRVRSTATSDLTGHLSATQKTWDLDFVDQSVVGGFALHLVGRITP